VFEGNGNMLVPGYWVDAIKDSPKDNINNSSSDIDSLRKLLKANRSIKSIESLKNEVTDKIAEHVAQKINKYNPEEQ